MNEENTTMTEEKKPEDRRKYQAAWQKKRYWADKEYREEKLRKAAVKYEGMSDQEKKDYSNTQKNYRTKREDKKIPTPDQKKNELSSKRKYYRKRRDANVVPQSRTKYEAMDEAQQGKFLSKLVRYRDVIADFSGEIAQHESITGK